MKRTLLLLVTCLMLLCWPQSAVMAELETAVFAGGCFWCLEHDLEDLPGVLRCRERLQRRARGTTPRIGR